MTPAETPKECRLINDPKGVTTCATHHALFPEPCTESFLELADARLAEKDARIRELVVAVEEAEICIRAWAFPVLSAMFPKGGLQQFSEEWLALAESRRGVLARSEVGKP